VHDDVHTPPPRSASPSPTRPSPTSPSPTTLADELRALPPPGRAWSAAFGLVLAVHLVAHLALPDGPPLQRWTQWLLMPLLAAALWLSTTVPRPRLVRLAFVALFWSWLGGSVPDFVTGQGSFLVLMALFLVAQVAYVVAFWPYRADSALTRRRGVVAAYAGVCLAIVGGAAAVLLPAGDPAVALVVGLAVYGAALVSMAVLATGVHRLAGIGGALFVASDGLRGVRQAMPAIADTLPAGVYGFAVMATYSFAQLLLVLGIRRRAVGGEQ